MYAAPIRVDCNRGGSINNTLASLASAGNTRGVTIFVTGTCRENVVITGFDRLVLQASPIATLQDASGGTAPVVQVSNSYDVRLSNFTINGGSHGVVCSSHSYCSVYSCTQQSAVKTGVVIGLGSEGHIEGNRLLNNGSRGLTVASGSNAETFSNTITGNVELGVLLYAGGNLTAFFDIVQNNFIGIALRGNATLTSYDLTIAGNSNDGVALDGASTALFEQLVTGNTVTGNGGHGVAIDSLSWVEFADTNNVSGNLTQPDVTCEGQYSVAEGTGTIGGTTDCSGPQKYQRHHLPQVESDNLSKGR